MVGSWPVDQTRACRYPLLAFESALRSNEGPRKPGELGAARKDLQECVGKMQRVLASLDASNRRFGDVLSALDRELAAIPVAPPPAPAAGGPAAAGEPRRPAR